MRTLSGAELAALSAPVVPLVVLVEIWWLDAPPLCVCTSGISVDLPAPAAMASAYAAAGQALPSQITYLGTGALGRIDTVSDTPTEIRPLSFELSGVPSAYLAMALGQPVLGKTIAVRSLLLDPATYAPLTPRLRWQGLGDVMMIKEQGGTATIQVQAEHCAAALLRPRPSYWSDAEQRRLYPGDPSLQYIADQVNQNIPWPAAAFFKQ